MNNIRICDLTTRAIRQVMIGTKDTCVALRKGHDGQPEEFMMPDGELLDESRAIMSYDVDDKTIIYSHDGVGTVVLFKTLKGDCTPILVDPSDKIQAVKQKYFEIEGNRPEKMLSSGREMKDDQTLGDFHVNKQSSVHVVFPKAVKTDDSKDASDARQGTQASNPFVGNKNSMSSAHSPDNQQKQIQQQNQQFQQNQQNQQQFQQNQQNPHTQQSPQNQNYQPNQNQQNYQQNQQSYQQNQQNHQQSQPNQQSQPIQQMNGNSGARQSNGPLPSLPSLPSVNAMESKRHQYDDLDLDMMVERINANERSNKSLEGRDIIFFIGKTGAGKTTTFNFLAGREMYHRIERVAAGGPFEEVVQDVLDCRDPLPGTAIGWQNSATTKAVTAYEESSSSVVLCDSPGFEDTEGLAVDIANMVGIYHAISCSRSARMVLLVPYSSFGSKANDLIAQLDLLARLVHPLSDYVKCFTVFYTRVPPGVTLMSIYALLRDLVKQAHVVGRPHVHAFVQMMLNEFDDKRNHPNMILTMLDQDYKTILKYIERSNSIQTQGCFRMGFSTVAESALGQKTKELQLVTMNDLRRANFGAVIDNMDKLQTMRNAIQRPDMKEVYELCAREITSTWEECIRLARQELLPGHSFAKLRPLMKTLHQMQALSRHVDPELPKHRGRIINELNDLARQGVRGVAESKQKPRNYVEIASKIEQLRELQLNAQDFICKSAGDDKYFTGKPFDDAMNLARGHIDEDQKDVLNMVAAISRPNVKPDANEQQLRGRCEAISAALSALKAVEFLSKFDESGPIGKYNDTLSTIQKELVGCAEDADKVINGDKTGKGMEPVSQEQFNVGRRAMLILRSVHFSAMKDTIKDDLYPKTHDSLRVACERIKDQAFGSAEYELVATCLTRLVKLKDIEEDFGSREFAEPFSLMVVSVQTRLGNIAKDMVQRCGGLAAISDKSDEKSMNGSGSTKWSTDVCAIINKDFVTMTKAKGLDAFIHIDYSQWLGVVPESGPGRSIEIILTQVQRMMQAKTEAVNVGCRAAINSNDIPLAKAHFDALDAICMLDSMLPSCRAPYLTHAKLVTELGANLTDTVKRERENRKSSESVAKCLTGIGEFLSLIRHLRLHDAVLKGGADLKGLLDSCEAKLTGADIATRDTVKSQCLSAEGNVQKQIGLLSIKRAPPTPLKVPPAKDNKNAPPAPVAAKPEAGEAKKDATGKVPEAKEGPAVVVNERECVLAVLEDLDYLRDTKVMDSFVGNQPSTSYSVSLTEVNGFLNTLEGGIRLAVAGSKLDEVNTKLELLTLCTRWSNHCPEQKLAEKRAQISEQVVTNKTKMVERVAPKLKAFKFAEVNRLLGTLRPADGLFDDTYDTVVDETTQFFENMTLTVTAPSQPGSSTSEKVALLYSTLERLLEAEEQGLGTHVSAFTDHTRNIRIQIEEVYRGRCTVFENLLKKLNYQHAIFAYHEVCGFQKSCRGKHLENESKYAEATRERLHRSLTENLRKLDASLTDAIATFSTERIDKIMGNLQAGVTDIDEFELDSRLDVLKAILKTKVQEAFQKSRDLVYQGKVLEASPQIGNLEMLFASTHVQTLCKQIDIARLKDDYAALLSSTPQKDSAYLKDLRLRDFAGYQKVMERLQASLKEDIAKVGAKLDTPFSEHSVEQLSTECNKLHKTLQELKKDKHLEENQGFLTDIPELWESFRSSTAAKFRQYLKSVQYQASQKNWAAVGDKLFTMSLMERFFGTILPENADFSRDVERLNVDMAKAFTASKALLQRCKTLDLKKEKIIWDPLNEELNAVRSSLGSNWGSEDKTSYTDICKELIKTIDATSATMEGLFDTNKFDLVYHFVLNMLDCNVLRGHETVYVCMSQKKDITVAMVKSKIEALTQKCKQIYDSGTLKELEPPLLLSTQMGKVFKRIPEIWSYGEHDSAVVALLIKDISTQMATFKTNHRTVDLDLIKAEIISRWSITKKISNDKIGSHVHQEISQLLSFYNGKPGMDYYELGMKLKDVGDGTRSTQVIEDAAIGADIVDRHAEFKAVTLEILHAKTSEMTPEISLEKMATMNKFPASQKAALWDAYQGYLKHYEAHVALYMDLSGPDLGRLVNQVKEMTAGARFDAQWHKAKTQLPEILAGICAVWTVSTSRMIYQKTKKMSAVMRPHPVQILAILTMLDVAPSTSQRIADTFKGWIWQTRLPKHLIQIGTGEGKSVVLGITSALLALLGMRVSCACYSKYLSTRDFEAFRAFFELFGVRDSIEYATITELTDRLINEDGDVRVATEQWITGTEVKRPDGPSPSSPSGPALSGERVLLIDEVDVFFGSAFFGATFNPAVFIKDPLVYDIANHIWTKRGGTTKLTVLDVQKIDQYVALTKKYPRFTGLIRMAVERMLQEVDHFNNPAYEVVANSRGENVIGYVEHGTVNTLVSFGYRTTFAFFNEMTLGHITQETVKSVVGLKVNCGQFSYAGIPKAKFSTILGVTGTLESLGQFERDIMEKDYGINKFTLTPSIYGDSQLDPRWKNEGVFVERASKEDFHQKILNDIVGRISDPVDKKKSRSVLVFFETKAALEEFFKSPYGSARLGDDLQVVTEETPNVDFYINRASEPGRVSILTRVLGRGLDFVVRDKRVIEAGGMHVIQTFLSEEFSEEIQVRGRTARQKNRGSYSMILHLPDLKEFGVTAAILDERKDATLYSVLHDCRQKYFQSKYKARQDLVDRTLALHKESEAYRANFSKRPLPEAELLRYLERQNTGVYKKSVTVCVSDATGSMGGYWGKTKQYIKEMLSRIQNVGGNNYLLRWVAYRDYTGGGQLVESSSWTSDANDLQRFVDKVECTGGGDYPEAIEQGLKVVTDETEHQVTSVILFADAPAHAGEIGSELKDHKKPDGTPYKLETNYRQQIEKMKKDDEKGVKGIPIYSFYLNEGPDGIVKKQFEEMSAKTGGQASSLKEVNALIHVLSETVLRDIGGEELVLQYRKEYNAKPIV